MTLFSQPHVCDLPYPDRTGMIFRCDDCGRFWRSSAPGNSDHAYIDAWALAGSMLGVFAITVRTWEIGAAWVPWAAGGGSDGEG